MLSERIAARLTRPLRPAISLLAVALLAAIATGRAARAGDENPALKPEALLHTGVGELVKMQEEDGAWPYEGVYRVGGEIPIGYRVAGTALVIEALLHAAPAGDESVSHAIDRGLEFIFSRLDDPLMKPSTADTYDVRVWGHCFALECFLHLRTAKRAGKFADRIREWIPRLVEALLTEELKGGGWNYANHRQPASFVTAPITQTLLQARAAGESVPDEVFERCRKVLRGGRQETGAFLYSGLTARGPGGAELPGSVARSAICESTLLLLRDGSVEAVEKALDGFHKHWDELEKRRKKTGTHMPPYGIAPYYFYYGHRYAAQAIELLPEAQRPQQRQRLLETILRTRDDDGTWNDRVFPRSRNYGTAMIVMALLQDRLPLPPPLPESARPASAPASAPAAGGK